MEIKYESLTLELNEDGNYTIIDCDKDVTEVNVPAEVNGVYITEIGDNAFEDCEKLVSITFQDDFDMFVLDQTIKRIGSEAFSGCSSLIRIEIPRAVGIIESGTFCNCTSLVEVSYTGSFGDEFIYIGNSAFYNCENLTIAPAGNRIGDYAFCDCTSLAKSPLGNYCCEIGERAFAHCTSLTELKMSKSLDRIDELAFRGCHNLKRVEFANTNGWYVNLGNGFGSRPIDVTNPEQNAKKLSGVDYDDGVLSWCRK